MILNGNSRGNAKDLALHLMKDENELVEIHQMRGFASSDLMSAFNEIYAISRATHCDQFLYSLSLSPPAHEDVSVSDFEAAIEEAEQRLNLSDQPRAIVFHTKNGRKHAHVVWSRIDIQTMKARQMSYDRKKLTKLSRELFIQHDWEMPNGLKKRGDKSPLNYSHAEYQHAQRIGKNAGQIKAEIQDAWHSSDCRISLEHALSEKGYFLARGDKRGFVVINLKGEIYSLPRYAGIKTKDVRARLGDPKDLPSVDDIQKRLEVADQEIQQKPYSKEDAIHLISRYHSAFTPKIMERTLKPIIGDEQKRQKLIKSILESSAITKIGTVKKQDVFASKDMIALEKKMIMDVQEMAETTMVHKPDSHFTEMAIYILNNKIIKDTNGKGQLSQQQAKSLRHMVSDKQISMVVGVAGSGKTTIMAGANDAFITQGYRVRGCAPSGIAASGLKEVGIDASTIHSLLGRIKFAEDMAKENIGKSLSFKQQEFIRNNTLTAKDVLIIDEAGMISSRQMAELIAVTKTSGAKLILVGDHEQLQSVEAGTAFKNLLERNEAVHINEVRRQKIGWQNNATLDLSQGKTAKALAAYNNQGCIDFAKNRKCAKEKLVFEYMDDFDKNPDTSRMVLAYTRNDVADLNTLMKQEMVKRGIVSEEIKEIDVTTTEQDQEIQKKQGFSVGDRILFRKNDANIGVMNGTFGKVNDINGDLFHVTLDNNKSLLFSTKDYNHLQLGYATTIHKSQGMTVDNTYVLATQHFDRNTSYVAMSRHKQNAKLYAAKSDFKNINIFYSSLGKASDKRSTLDFTVPVKESKLSFKQKATNKIQTIWNKVARHSDEQSEPYNRAQVEHLKNGHHQINKKHRTT